MLLELLDDYGTPSVPGGGRRADACDHGLLRMLLSEEPLRAAELGKLKSRIKTKNKKQSDAVIVRIL